MPMVFDFQHLTNLNPSTGWSIRSGRFLQPGKAGILAVHNQSGQLRVGEMVSATQMQFSARNTKLDFLRGRFTAGNFVGSVLSDLVYYEPTSGALTLLETLPTAFSNPRPAGKMTPTTDWQFCSGKFQSSAFDSLCGYHSATGEIWVGKYANATGFTFTKWATVSPAAGWNFAAANFRDGALSELVGYHPSNGTIWRGKNLGTGFQFELWTTLPTAGDWRLMAVDVAATGLGVLTAYQTATGKLFQYYYPNTSPSPLVLDPRATVTPAAGWQFQSGEFDTNTGVDVIGYHPSNGSVWLGKEINKPQAPGKDPPPKGKDDWK